VPLARYYLYIAGFDGSTEQVGVAISDDQKTWKISPEPIIPLGKPGEWDAVQTSNPSVLYEDGRFRMWYQGVDERNCYRIGYAESEDGWTWQKRPDVMFERADLKTLERVPRREGYHQPLVFRENSEYWMYFSEHRDGLGSIRVAKSADGLSWDVLPEKCLSPETSWEQLGLHYPWVLHEENGYTLWYTTEDYKHHWFLARAVSSDGIHWQRNPADRPVIGKETTRKVSLGHFWMPRHLLKWYPNYRHPKIRNGALKQLKTPDSLLGKFLVEVYDRVIFPLRSRRYMSFNNSSVVKKADGSYLMYFQSRDENGTLSVGRCTSRDGIHWGNTETSVLKETITREGYEWCSVFDADPHLLVIEP
jgi:predicted GH43/DUF377 family glycosyl hydrolase